MQVAYLVRVVFNFSIEQIIKTDGEGHFQVEILSFLGYAISGGSKPIPSMPDMRKGGKLIL